MFLRDIKIISIIKVIELIKIIIKVIAENIKLVIGDLIGLDKSNLI